MIERFIIDKRGNLYLFYGETCPHCKEEEKFLKFTLPIEKSERTLIKIKKNEIMTDEEERNKECTDNHYFRL